MESVKIRAWQAVLLPLVALPAFVLGAFLIHVHTTFVYSRPSNAYLTERFIILAATALVFGVGTLLLHRKGKDLPTSLSGAAGLLIVVALLLFTALTWRILIGALVAAPIIVATAFAFTYRPMGSTDKSFPTGVAGIFYGLSIAALAAACVWGILLMSTAFHRAQRSEQWKEIRQKNLLIEVHTLDALRAENNFEYVRLHTNGLSLRHPHTYRFGSGDSSFSLTYAQLADGSVAAQDLATWPFWMLSGTYFFDNTIYAVSRQVRCKAEADCEKDFRKVRAEVLRKAGLTARKTPAEFIILEPDDELSHPAEYWDNTLRGRFLWVLALQGAYFAFFACGAFLLQRRSG